LTALWPLFHYLLWQDVATEYASADQHWPAYEAANAAFATAVLAAYRPGDIVWVHDYHLLLVPRLLRQLEIERETAARPPGKGAALAGPEDGAQAVMPQDGAVVGLFLHTPFPSSEIFRCLPRRKEILDGMLGANLVCFQTYSYERHFTSCCVRVCGYEIAPGRGIDTHGHVVTVTHCPVGVDAGRVTKDL
jgi:trehalose 6-phosphate synthase/phosphatase